MAKRNVSEDGLGKGLIAAIKKDESIVNTIWYSYDGTYSFKLNGSVIIEAQACW